MADLLDPVKDLKTIKRFPPSLRGTIYEAMLEAVSEELSVWRDAIRLQKTSFYDVDFMGVDRLTEICGTFGVPFIASAKSDIFFLQEEVRSIPIKIYYKGTPTLYKSFFYAVDRYGEMFIYIYRADVDTIVRSMLEPFDEAYSFSPNLPFRHKSRGDFSGSIEDWLKLDTNLYLDAGDALWKLDTSATEITTNHIGLEYFIDRIISKKEVNIVTGAETMNEYLMTKEYLDYMNQSIEFARRAKEVPHIGSQLSVQSQADGLCNSYDSTSEYSVPSLKLKVVTRPDFFNLVSSPHDISFVEFGIGKKDMASVQNPDIVFPTELASKICSIPILFRDQIEDAHFVGAIGEYLGQSLNGFRILDDSVFDGKLQEFNFNLPFPPIQRGNIVLSFYLPTGEILQVSDDRKGILLSLNGYGTVDYKTGECYISTKFDYSQVDSMEMVVPPGYPDPTDGRTHFIHTLQGGTSVVPNSLWLAFTIGDGAAQRIYIVNDTPEPDFNDVANSEFPFNDILVSEFAWNVTENGNFNHSLIQFGTVNYITKTLNIIFKAPLVDPSIKPFNCKYSFLVDFKLPAGTELLASYFFTQQSICITEAGFRNKDGDLLNYATFPPFEFNSMSYHLDLMILVKKPEVQ